MATINAQTEAVTFKISEWLGLHEAPDGDTKLKMSEASVMRNWRVTKDKNLQRRPGNAMIAGLLKGYKLEESETKEIKREERQASTMVLWETVEASPDGFPTVGGDSASVTPENFSDYAGWYWHKGKYYTYQIMHLAHEGDEWIWYGKEITAVPDTDDADYEVHGMWTGEVGGDEFCLVACNGVLWNIFDAATQSWGKWKIGNMEMDGRVTFVPFDEKLYILTGIEMYEFDGTFFMPVMGYRPLISVANVPAGGGTLLEEVNKLNGLRRVRFTPDGESTTFVLPEVDLISIDYVMDTSTGEYLDPSDYTPDPLTGTVLFDTAPEEVVNGIEIGYTAAAPFRPQVTRMRFAEKFLGATDNTLFIYGDGSNEAFYSGVDYLGHARADYFPDLNEMAVGDSAEPITALTRHMSRLIVFKTNSTWSVTYGAIQTADGLEEYGFYVTPINRSLGCSAPGMVQTVENNPIAPHDKQLYQWTPTGYYNTNLSSDERTAKRISDKIYSTLGQMDLTKAYTFNDNADKEYYICEGGRALVWNTQVNAWYEYTDFDVTAMCKFGNYLIFGTSDGRAECMSYRYKTNDGKEIESYYESGSMDFGRAYQRKYSAQMWVALKPETSGYVTVTVQTDKKSEYAEKVVSSDIFGFTRMNFKRFSFSTNRKPQITKLKIKAKKFVYYKLILKTDSSDTAATVNEVDIRVRYTGDSK